MTKKNKNIHTKYKRPPQLATESYYFNLCFILLTLTVTLQYSLLTLSNSFSVSLCTQVAEVHRKIFHCYLHILSSKARRILSAHVVSLYSSLPNFCAVC